VSRRTGRVRKPAAETETTVAAEGARPPLVTVRQAAVYVAASLIYATIHFLFVGLPIGAVPVSAHLALSVEPDIIVPVFMGLTAGPLAGLLVGLGGRFLGDLLAGLGVAGFGLMLSAVAGLAAGLGYQRLTGYRTLRQVLIAFGFGLLACAAASLVSVLLLQTLVWRDWGLVDGLYHTLSQFLSSVSMVLLLISTPLYVWGWGKKADSSRRETEAHG